MNRPCPPRRDQIADYVLGALDAQQAKALQQHLAGCDTCRGYARSLEDQADSLVALGGEIDDGMAARRDRVIEALQKATPIQAGATRVVPFISGFVRMAVAAALVLGAGVLLGRWTAPRPVDIEQLRTDLQASLAASLTPTVQEVVLAQVDQRLHASLATGEANLRARLGDQLRGDLQLFATQFAAGSQRQMERRLTELIQLIEEARLKDRQYVAKALDRIEQERIRDRARIGLGLESLASLTAKATPAVQH
jgi:anti-sigma factor RsiW